jgi:hypothetical protein
MISKIKLGIMVQKTLEMKYHMTSVISYGMTSNKTSKLTHQQNMTSNMTFNLSPDMISYDAFHMTSDMTRNKISDISHDI